MVKDNKINSYALCGCLFSLCSSTFYGIFSSYVINTSKTDTLFSMIIGYIISLFISTIILKLFNLNQSDNMNNKIKKSYKKLSIIINIIILICSLFIYIFISYRLTSFISNQYLTTINKSYIYILIILITYNIVSKGIETTTRVNTICIYICLIIYSLIVIGLYDKINIDNYLPLFNQKISKVLTSSLIFSIYFSLPVFYINISKKDDLVDKEKFNKLFYKFHFFTFLIVFIAIMFTIGIYGVNLSNIFEYPVYTVLNRIKISTFIDSVENILVMFWLICSINSSAIVLLFILKNTKLIIKKNNKLIDIILLIILFLLPTIFYKNSNYFETFNYLLFPVIISLIILIITFITYIILKKNSSKRTI